MSKIAGIYRSILQGIYAKEGKKPLFFFHPPKLGDPPHKRELIAPLNIPPTSIAAVTVTTRTQLWPIDRRPVLLLSYYGRLCIKQVVRGGSLPSPVFGVIQQGGDGSVPSLVFVLLCIFRNALLLLPF